MRYLWILVTAGILISGLTGPGIILRNDSAPCSATPADRPDGDRPAAFDIFLQPLVDVAMQKRSQWAQQDAQYGHRVDSELSAHRLNVAVLGFGEEHGQTYDETGVSVTIVSLDLTTWQVASVSLSRDIRTPELEDQTKGEGRAFQVLRDSYHILGFAGMRRLLEEMTGLPIDYEIVIKDILVHKFLDEITGPISVDIPKEFHTNAYRLGGVEHAPDFIPAGPARLDADHAMTFILGEEEDPQGKLDERSYRKNLLLGALTCQMKERFANRDSGYLLNVARFAISELHRGDELQTDFDFPQAVGGLARVAQVFVTARGDLDTSFPSLSTGRQLVIHDKYYGDGGVRRGHNILNNPDEDGPDNPSIERELAVGLLPGNILVPISGDPYSADLVRDYWRSVRELIHEALT